MRSGISELTIIDFGVGVKNDRKIAEWVIGLSRNQRSYNPEMGGRNAPKYAHSQLIKDIVEEFGARYIAGGRLVYVGDTGDKHGFFDVEFLASLGVTLDNHGKLPDVIIYNPSTNWLFLIESVTSHGPVDHKRYGELKALFGQCSAGLVYVSAFPDSKTYAKYSSVIAWETEVWIADAPTHMIHFNGSRFLGPYE